MKQPKLTLKNGKFYRGSEEVAPEFGNKEQIELIRKFERLSEEYSSKDGLTKEVDFDSFTVIYAEFQFDCVCGKIITIDGEDGGSWVDGERDEALKAMMRKNKITCSCGRSYDLALEGEDVNVRFSKTDQK